MPRAGTHRASVLLTAWTAAQRIDQLVTNELAAAGVQTLHYPLLVTIHLREPITPRALADEMGIPGATLSDRLRDLFERGHIQRTPNPADGRSYLIGTTAAGRALLDRAAPPTMRARKALERELRVPLEQVEAAVDELNHALRAALEPRESKVARPRRQRYA